MCKSHFSALSIVAALALNSVANASQSPEIHSFDDAFRALSRRSLSPQDVQSLSKWVGERDLASGNPRSEDLRFIFAIQVPGPEMRVVATSDDGKWTLSLRRLARTNVYAAETTLPELTGFRWSYRIGSERKGGGELEAYTHPKETRAQPGVPKGTLEEQELFKSKVFEGTTRHWWIYVPKQYDGSKPACLFVVQDGQWARGSWTTVLDNMIAEKQIPISIAVFITPGTIKTDIDNRSVEYDTVSDRYVTMLADEILPQVTKRYNIRPDARGHVIAGGSSGGICSFNAAWYRPDLFHKVISWIGSFTNLQGGATGVAGGNTYPAIIRALRGWDEKGEPKPLRVFLQDGRNDVNNKAGNWPLANQEMASALEFGHYDYRFELGNGFHSDKYGRALLPDTLRWLFRDEEK